MNSGRWPITLWLYILKDMWRLIALTAAVLVTVIAFAATIKPLADGQLSPTQCLKFMGLAMLPMLQYALPFAACFGATLAYYRFASDNEVTAAHAGGVSHRAMLVPVAVTGVVLAVVIWWLANSTIPRFLKGMAEMVSQNATQFIESRVLQGQAIESTMGGKPAYVYADIVRRQPMLVTEAGAYDSLYLKSILFVTLGPDNQIDTQGTTREAMIWVKRGGSSDGESATEVLLRPDRSTVFDANGRAEIAVSMHKFLVPNKFRDDPKFMTVQELIEVARNPELLPQVERRRRALALALAEDEMTRQIRERLRATKALELLEVVEGKASKVIVRARDIRRNRAAGNVWRIVPIAGQPVLIEQYSPDGHKLKTMAASEANLGITRKSQDPQNAEELAVVNIMFHELSVVVPEDVDTPDASLRPGAIGEWPLRGLQLVQGDSDDILNDSSDNLVRAADAKIAASKALDPVLAGARQDLLNRTADLLREVFSKHNERLAMAFACLVMVMTGAVMAMRLRDSLPLTIYLWAFFPALGAVLTISTGQQITHQSGPIGLLMLWGGVIGLGIYTWVKYRGLARN